MVKRPTRYKLGQLRSYVSLLTRKNGSYSRQIGMNGGSGIGCHTIGYRVC